MRTDIAVASRAVQMAVRTTARTTGVVQEDSEDGEAIIMESSFNVVVVVGVVWLTFAV